MPIQEIRALSTTRAVAFWKVTEGLNDLLDQSKLRDDELTFLRSFKNEQKQKEWITGRLTVEKLTKWLKLEYRGIDKTESGKPILRSNNGEISLSHSYPYVAVIYDSVNPVGIDLEQPTYKLQRIAKKFLSPRELDFTQNDVMKLCICWCAKETLYKIYSLKGLLFKENLAIESFEIETKGIISGSIIVNNSEKKYNLQYIVHEDYILTYNV